VSSSLIVPAATAGNLLVMLQMGSMPTDLVKHNIDLFAGQVMPAPHRHLVGVRGGQPLVAGPDWVAARFLRPKPIWQE
jgi:hypothetical protein